MCKLTEKLIKNRLVHYLETNNLITKIQSGFRANKCTIDNVFYFKQKCLEAFSLKRQNQVNKMCGIVFDIEKAFDKVWHQGLLYKMHQLKIPKTIAKWIMNFLSNRAFIVKVNGKKSKKSYKSRSTTRHNSITNILHNLLLRYSINSTKLRAHKQSTTLRRRSLQILLGSQP